MNPYSNPMSPMNPAGGLYNPANPYYYVYGPGAQHNTTQHVESATNEYVEIPGMAGAVFISAVVLFIIFAAVIVLRRWR